MRRRFAYPEGESPPSAERARTVTILSRRRPDNLALVPGSFLRHRQQWQTMANRLPVNAVLVVLPANRPIQKHALLVAAAELARRGHQVRVVAADEVGQTAEPLDPD